VECDAEANFHIALYTAIMDSHHLLQDIKHLIEATDHILITGQGNPDGDSLGSQLALYDILVQQKQAVGFRGTPDIVICNDSPPPAQYHFFPKIDLITPVETIQDRRFDVGFVLDAGIDRVGKVLPILERCREIIVIDHHQSHAQGTDHIAWIDPTICAVAEMIYAFIEHPAWQVTLTPDIAACLYAGLIYDTGSFRYPKTSARTHRIVAQLLETGIDFASLSEQMFLVKPFSAIQLLAGVLQHLQRDASGEIIWGVITQELLRRTQSRLEEDEGIITRYAFTRDTNVAVLFKEVSASEVKMSFRSRGALDVGQFAHYISPGQGGGHQRAAGCTLQGTLPEVQERVIAALQEELQHQR
jgi:phosphoesterase RecJ-like protein